MSDKFTPPSRPALPQGTRPANELRIGQLIERETKLGAWRITGLRRMYGGQVIEIDVIGASRINRHEMDFLQVEPGRRFLENP